MPRQNRVTPFGTLIATAERGTFMGNRGRLHAPDGRILRPWQVKRWLLCVLEFRGRRRTVMHPDRYTELFFLDEATGLAAGHRPCAECRYAAFRDFVRAWTIGSGHAMDAPPITADALDAQLHRKRIDATRQKPTFPARLGDLPDGVFVATGDDDDRAALLWHDALHTWSPGGYTQREVRPRGEKVKVLTPRSTVAAIENGYVPQVHPTADRA
jgi:hypothetical protein